MRVELNISFTIIVAVKMLISSSGIGCLVWIARTYLKPEWTLDVVIPPGLIAYTFSFCPQWLGKRYLGHFGIR